MPVGVTTVKLKNTGETFSFTRPKAKLHNYIVGAPYLWFSGEMVCTNQTTGDKAVLNFKPKGWTSKSDYVCEGFVYNAKGVAVYALDGLWNSHLTATHSETSKEVLLAKRKDEPDDISLQYYFSKFLINVNHLTKEMVPKIAPTDTRLRPDQRAYEYGDNELAAKEKTRLEENQRSRKVTGEEKEKKVWKPLWFDFTMDGNDINSRFKGEYWKCRESGKWPEQILDLYNDPTN